MEGAEDGDLREIQKEGDMGWGLRRKRLGQEAIRGGGPRRRTVGGEGASQGRA